MGVTILQPFPIENRTGAQTIELLSKRLLALGAVPSGQFLVDCDLFENQNFGQSRIVHVLHNSEYPASVFSILDTGTKTIPLITDGLFDLLMLKMTPIYTAKKQIKVESKGPRFELGDFLVKLGSVTMSQNFKGVLVEVDYRPCLVPINCWELLREFMQGFLGSHVPNSIPAYFTILVPNSHNPAHTTPRMNEVYQPIDTIQQYLEHFNNYRKQVHPHANF